MPTDRAGVSRDEDEDNVLGTGVDVANEDVEKYSSDDDSMSSNGSDYGDILKEKKTNAVKNVVDVQRSKTLHHAGVPTNELLAYYRARVDEFEREREDWLARLDMLRPSQEELHKAKWEARIRCEEVTELQRALSEAHNALYDEREQILKLARENDDLKLREIEDKRKMDHLMSLTEPVEQEVTYFRDARPDKVQKYVVKTPAMGTPSAGLGGGSGMVGGVSAEQRTSRLGLASSVMRPASSGGPVSALRSSEPKPRPVLRTINLPTEQVEQLTLEVHALKKQLEEERLFHSQRSAAWDEERRVREDEVRLGVEHSRQITTELQQKQKKTEDLLNRTTKDYLTLRHNSQMLQRKLKEENEMLKAKNNRLIEEMKSLAKRTQTRTKVIEDAAEFHKQDYAKQFRKQMAEKDENLTIVKEQYGYAQKLYESRVTNLEMRLSKLRDRYRELEKRRNFEVQGFEADVTVMKRLVKDYEKELKRLQRVAENPVDLDIALHAEEGHGPETQLSDLKAKLNVLQSRIAKVQASHRVTV